MMIRGTAVKEVTFVRGIHGKDEVIELGIARKKCTGSRGEFDSAATRLSTGPFVGRLSTMPSSGPSAVHLDPTRKSRLIDERTHDPLGRWGTTDVAETNKAQSKWFR
jgi:hypothetical protein